ncbi:MAG: TraB/GumN family protein, partial [Novosphingobium sp.]
AATAREDGRRLQQAWLRGDIAELAALDHQGLLADSELREALLVRRNRVWMEQLVPMLKRGEKPLVAVGSLHLVGRDGLVAQLEAQGYKVTRLQ